MKRIRIEDLDQRQLNWGYDTYCASMDWTRYKDRIRLVTRDGLWVATFILGPTVQFEQRGKTMGEAVGRAALHFRVGDTINVPIQYCEEEPTE